MEISTLSSTLCLPSFQKPSLISSSKSSSFLNHSSTHLLKSVNNSGLGLRAQTPTNRTRKGFVCNSLFGLGVPELAVIAGVAALVFGPKQLPEIGKNFGKTIKSFQQAAKEFEEELKKPGEEAGSSDNVLETKSASESSEEKENVVSSSKESS